MKTPTNVKQRRQWRSKKIDPTTPAGRVISKFSGFTQMSEDTGIPLGTIYAWAQTGLIPSTQFAGLLAHAKRLGIKLLPGDFVPAPAELPEPDAE